MNTTATPLTLNEIQQHHQLKLDKRSQEEKKRRLARYKTFVGGAVITALLNGIGSPLQVIAMGMLVQAAYSTVMCFIRQYYLDWSASRYHTNSPALTGRQRFVFKKGMAATSTLSYFQSFLDWRTYRHPLIFAAGLELQLENNQEVIDQLMGRLPFEQREHSLVVTISCQANQTTFQNSIRYDSAASLKRQITQLIRDANQHVYPWQQEYTLKITRVSDHQNCYPDLKKSLQHIILEQPSIRKIEFKALPLAPALQDKLEKLSKELQNRSHANQFYIKKDRQKLLLQALSGALFSLLRFGRVVVPGLIVYTSLFTILGYLKQAYHDYAKSKFKSTKSLNQANHSTRLALQCGLQASTWKGYFLSYLPLDEKRRSAIKHPLAFRAALEYQNAHQGHLTKVIRKLQ